MCAISYPLYCIEYISVYANNLDLQRERWLGQLLDIYLTSYVDASKHIFPVSWGVPSTYTFSSVSTFYAAYSYTWHASLMCANCIHALEVLITDIVLQQTLLILK